MPRWITQLEYRQSNKLEMTKPAIRFRPSLCKGKNGIVRKTDICERKKLDNWREIFIQQIRKTLLCGPHILKLNHQFGIRFAWMTALKKLEALINCFGCTLNWKMNPSWLQLLRVMLISTSVVSRYKFKKRYFWFNYEKSSRMWDRKPGAKHQMQ